MSKDWFVTGVPAASAAALLKPAVPLAKRSPRLRATPTRWPTWSQPREGAAAALDVTGQGAPRGRQRGPRALGRLRHRRNNDGYGLFLAPSRSHQRAQRSRPVRRPTCSGPLWVTQGGHCRHLRSQGSGQIVQISYMAGSAGLPTWADTTPFQVGPGRPHRSLAGEVTRFGIKVTLVEPGGYAHRWGAAPPPLQPTTPAYEGYTRQSPRPAGLPGGDPAAAARAMLKVVDAGQPPDARRLSALPSSTSTTTYAERLKNLGRVDRSLAEADASGLSQRCRQAEQPP